MSKGKQKEEQEHCVICLEPLSISSQAFAWPCRHVYDFACLLNWLELRRSCPLCNAVVESVQTTDSDTGESIHHHLPHPKPVPPKPSLPRPYRPHSPPSPPDPSLARRRFVYKHRLRSRHIGCNALSKYKPFTPRSFRASEEQQSRARAWVRRELSIFEWTEKNREFLVEYIIAIVKSMDLKGANGAAEDLLAGYLGRVFAGVFCHELYEFLKSPCASVGEWDRRVQYGIELPG
ncbi:hypothetical protein RUND412_001122 [Rhizina undulata]